MERFLKRYRLYIDKFIYLSIFLMMLFLEKTMLLTPLFLNLLALYFLAVEVIAILFSLKVKGEGNRIKLDKYQRIEVFLLQIGLITFGLILLIFSLFTTLQNYVVYKERLAITYITSLLLILYVLYIFIFTKGGIKDNLTPLSFYIGDGYMTFILLLFLVLSFTSIYFYIPLLYRIIAISLLLVIYIVYIFILKKNKEELKEIWVKRSTKFLSWLSSFFSFILIFLLASYLTFISSPNLFTILIRYSFKTGTDDSEVLSEEYLAIKDDVEVIKNEKYSDKYYKNEFDIYYKKGNENPLATIVWTHGGGFVGGSKEIFQYFSLLANEGYTVVAYNYDLAPEATYPTPLYQLDDMVRYLEGHYGDYVFLNGEGKEIDIFNEQNLIFGGDSAGAQITAQYLTALYDENLRDKMDYHPLDISSKIAADLLFCGPYDFDKIKDNSEGFIGTLISNFGFAYLGMKDYTSSPYIDEVNVIANVNENFPETFLTDGNNFTFLNHSKALETRLEELNVPCESYYPSDNEPEGTFNHEYQFDFINYKIGANECFSRVVQFLGNVI